MIKFNAMRRRIPVLKRLIPSFKKLYCRIFWRDGMGTVRSHGALFRVNYKNFVERQIAFYDDFEEAQLAYLTSEIEKMGADTFLDIGANIGFYSVIIAHNRLVANVIAFEPDQRNIVGFNANVSLNDLTGCIQLQQCAVSANSGALNFQPGPDNSTGQSMIAADDAPGISVPALSIDDFSDLSGRKIAMKIDVEGHELDVLRGMRRTLRENECLLQIEIYRENIPLVTALLSEIGYKLSQLIEHDHFFSR